MLAFHVNVALHAALDHNTRTPAMAVTQFIRLLLIVFFARSTGASFQEMPISHVQDSMLDCSTDSVIRGEFEGGKHSLLH